MRSVRFIAAVASAAVGFVAIGAVPAYAAPGEPKLQLTVSRGGGTAPGDTATYAFTVHNTGAAAGLVTLATTFDPAGLTFAGGTGTGWTCPAAAPASPLACTLPALAEDGTAAVTLSFTVTALPGATVTVVSTASTPGELAGKAKNTATSAFVVTSGVPVDPEPTPSESASVDPEPTPSESASVEPSPSESEVVEPEPSPSESETVEPEPSPSESASVEPEPSESEVVEPEPSPSELASVEPEPSPSESEAVEPSPSESASVEPEPSPSETVVVEPDENGAPEFTGASTNAAQTIQVGGVPVPLEATDPDDDPVTFAVAGGLLPPGLTLLPDGTFAGAAEDEDVVLPVVTLAARSALPAVYVATVTVTDAPGATTPGTLVVTVLPVTTPDTPADDGGTPPPAPVDPPLPEAVLPESHVRTPSRAATRRQAGTAPDSLPHTGIAVSWLVAVALALVGAGGGLVRVQPRHRR